MTTVLTKAKHADFIRSVLPDAKIVEGLDGIRETKCLIAYQTDVIVSDDVRSISSSIDHSADKLLFEYKP